MGRLPSWPDWVPPARRGLAVAACASAVWLCVVLPTGPVAADDTAGVAGVASVAGQDESGARAAGDTIVHDVAAQFESAWNVQMVDRILALLAADVLPAGARSATREQTRAWLTGQIAQHPRIVAASMSGPGQVTWSYETFANRWQSLGVNPERGSVVIQVMGDRIQRLAISPTLRWAAQRDSAYAAATRTSGIATSTAEAQVRATAYAQGTAVALQHAPRPPDTQGRGRPAPPPWPLAIGGTLVATLLSMWLARR